MCSSAYKQRIKSMYNKEEYFMANFINQNDSYKEECMMIQLKTTFPSGTFYGGAQGELPSGTFHGGAQGELPSGTFH